MKRSLLLFVLLPTFIMAQEFSNIALNGSNSTTSQSTNVQTDNSFSSHDVMIKDILVDASYKPGAYFIPEAIVKNVGLYQETIDAVCDIKLGDNTVYTEHCLPVNLNPDQEMTISFPGYTLNSANDLYEVKITTNLTGDMDFENNEYEGIGSTIF